MAEKSIEYTYDRPASIRPLPATPTWPETELVAQATYGYDRLGRLVNVDLHGRRQQYTCPLYVVVRRDGEHVSIHQHLRRHGQLCQRHTGQLLSDGQSNQSYVYDANGNRDTVTTGNNTVTYVTGANNELLFDGTYHYQYDAEGNRIARWVAATRPKRSPASATPTSPLHVGQSQPADRGHALRELRRQRRHDGRVCLRRLQSLARRKSYEWQQRGCREPAVRVRWQPDRVAIRQNRRQAISPPPTFRHRYLWGAAVDQLMADEQVHFDSGQAAIRHRRTSLGTDRPRKHRARS